jgi:hypothetical protein
MSWPENFYRPRERKPNSEGTYRPANSLSARAMQLSIFGSMVCSIDIYLQRYVPKHLSGIIAGQKMDVWNFYIDGCRLAGFIV